MLLERTRAQAYPAQVDLDVSEVQGSNARETEQGQTQDCKPFNLRFTPNTKA